MKVLDLCRPCAETLKTGFDLKQIKGGINNKITCDECKRRRYGGTYEVAPKKKGGG